MFKKFLTDPEIQFDFGTKERVRYSNVKIFTDGAVKDEKYYALKSNNDKLREAFKKEMFKEAVEKQKELEKSRDTKSRLNVVREERRKLQELYYQSFLNYKKGTLHVPWKHETCDQKELQERLANLHENLAQESILVEPYIKSSEKSNSAFEKTYRDNEAYYTNIPEQNKVPPFLHMIPTDLDILEYIENLEKILTKFNSFRSNTSDGGWAKLNWKNHLSHFAKNNSCFFYIEAHSTFEYCEVVTKHTGPFGRFGSHGEEVKKTEKSLHSFVLKEGFYTPGSFYKEIIKMVKAAFPSHELSMTLFPVQDGIQYQIFMGANRFIRCPSAMMMQEYFDKYITDKHQKEYRISGPGDFKSIIFKKSDLALNKTLILRYISKMEAKIKDPTKTVQDWLQMASRRGNTVISLGKDYSFYCYMYDDTGPSLGVKGDENTIIALTWNTQQPLKITIPQGFYTPYSLVAMCNSLLPMNKIYWFSIDCDLKAFHIKVETMENGYLRFESGWDKLFQFSDARSEQAFQNVIQHRVNNGAVLSFPTLYNRMDDVIPTTYPYGSFDATQIQERILLIPKPESMSTYEGKFMSAMFNDPTYRIPKYTSEEFEKNFNVGFHQNTQKYLHFTSGQTITTTMMNRKRKLTDVKVPFLGGTNSLHLYSNSLYPREGALIDILKEKEFLQPFHKIVIPQGQYTIASLINFINREAQTWLPGIEMRLDENNDLHIKTGSYHYIDLRGFNYLINIDLEYLPPDTQWSSQYPVDLIPPSYNLIIYCNLVRESIVGGQREQVLRIFPTRKRKLGEMISETMTSVDYYSLYQYKIRDVEIKFYGDDGELVPMTQGRSYVKLHLRRKEGSLGNPVASVEPD